MFDFVYLIYVTRAYRSFLSEQASPYLEAWCGFDGGKVVALKETWKPWFQYLLHAKDVTFCNSGLFICLLKISTRKMTQHLLRSQERVNISLCISSRRIQITLILEQI